MSIEEEIARVAGLEHVGAALVQFSRSLFRGEFKKKSSAWIYSPNFVGFEIRYLRQSRLNLLVYPTVMPPEVQKVLTLGSGPLSFGRAEISSPRQLSAACMYIEASWLTWYRDTFKEEPNKAPEPTTMAVTPRATS